MRFSIVVVSLNPGKGLKDTLDSIKAQNFKDFEVIIKDGGSKDGSLEFLRDYEDLSLRLFTEEDRGIYDAMNQALTHTEGQYIYFLNCGDFFASSEVLGCVDRAISEAEKKNGAAEYIFYGNIFERKTGQRVMSNPTINGFACYRNVPCHQACFYDRRLIVTHPFDNAYKVRADYEQFLWCFYKGKASFIFLNETIAEYEGGGYSETKKGLEISKKEHKTITETYMEKWELFKYRLIMALTLSYLRSALAANPHTAKIYDDIKNTIYSKRSLNQN